MLRLTSGQWSVSADKELPVLYRSDHFIVVDKRFDLKVNSDDPMDSVTVATLLRRQYPDLVDSNAFHGFRLETAFTHLSISVKVSIAYSAAFE